VGIRNSFTKGFSYTPDEGKRIADAAAYRIKGMHDEPVGKRYKISGYEAARLIEQGLPGRARRVVRGVRQVVVDAFVTNFLEGYRHTEEETYLSRARAVLRQGVNETVEVGRINYKLNRTEAIASYSRWIPGRALRVARGCRTVAQNLLSKRRARD